MRRHQIRACCLLIPVITITALEACTTPEPTSTAPTRTVSSVPVTAAATQLLPGGGVQLRATCLDADGHQVASAISWPTSSIAVAYVSPIGPLTAVAPGSVDVNAFRGEAVGTITVTVDPTPIQIQLDQPTATIGDGTRRWRNVPTPLTCGLAFKDDSVSGATGWGENGYRQLGDGTTTRRLIPTKVTDVPPFVRISTGGNPGCGLTSSGTAWCWGANDWGQLGNGVTSTPSQPSPGAGFSFGEIGGGVFHTYVRTQSGAIDGWGNNRFGQPDDGTETQRVVPTPVRLP